VRRREFITLLGGAAAAHGWSIAARAQASSVHSLIGMLSPLSARAATRNVAAFRSALRDLGYVEGRNVTMEFRFGDGVAERMAPLAYDLVTLKPDVLVAGSQSGACCPQRDADHTDRHHDARGPGRVGVRKEPRQARG
jgi:putative ABC transport system substrate-binding protein